MVVHPIVRGMYLCENIVVHQSHNLTLQNCFRAMKVKGLPCAPKPFFVLISLANGFGPMRASLQIRRLDTLEPIYLAATELTFTDRLQEVRFKARISQCVFPGPGSFEVLFWIDDSLLAQSPFTVEPLVED